MLTNYVTVYVPTTLHAAPAPKKIVNDLRDNVKTTLSKLFGGYTETIARGGWYSDDLNKIISERVYLIKAYADKIEAADLDTVKQLCLDVKLRLDQEAVSLEVNNTLEFI